MKKTEWFPADVKPIRVGVYETKSPVFDGEPGWFSYWDGSIWGPAYFYQEVARLHAGRKSKFQNREWRGLAEKPE